MKLVIALAGMCAGLSALAAPLFDEPMSELKLNDGRTFHDAHILSFSPNTVLLRHSDGGTAIAYNLFPSSFQTELKLHRPAGKTDSEREADAAYAAQRLAAEHAVIEQKRQRMIENAAINAKLQEAAALDAKAAALERKVHKNGLWIENVRMGEGNSLFLELRNDSAADASWHEVDLMGISHAGNPCEVTRVVSMNMGENLFATMNVPAGTTKRYHVSFTCTDGTWPSGAIWAE